MTADSPARKKSSIRVLVLLLTSAAGAAALRALQIPAGILIGSIMGSALANRAMSRGNELKPLPPLVRTAGLTMLGCAVAVRINADVFTTLGHVAVPLLIAIAVLLLLDLVLGCVLMLRYGLDAATGVLACAPGGLSGVAVTAQQLGARTGIVLAVHTVRVLAVVLAVLPLLVSWLG